MIKVLNLYAGIGGNRKLWEKNNGFCLDCFNVDSNFKRTVLRNCVNPLVGKFIFDAAFKHQQSRLV